MARLALALLVVGTALCAGACQDPCVALAERICGCEADEANRRDCRTVRIVQQQSNINIDDADRDFCEAKLATCTCSAIDENQLEQCGFVPEEP